LIESLVTEVVVVDPEPARRAFSVTPMGVERALVAALDDQDEEVTRSLFARRNGLADGVYSVVLDVNIPQGTEDVVVGDLETIGGRLSWYGAVPGWIARLVLGRLVGERLRRYRPEAVVSGALVDWWRIAWTGSGELVLRSVGWFPGDAWLGYRPGRGTVRQVAAFRPRGIPGFLYWMLLKPIHRVAFDRMARRRVAGLSGSSDGSRLWSAWMGGTRARSRVRGSCGRRPFGRQSVIGSVSALTNPQVAGYRRPGAFRTRPRRERNSSLGSADGQSAVAALVLRRKPLLDGE
jgi:hypothetical protein